MVEKSGREGDDYTQNYENDDDDDEEEEERAGEIDEESYYFTGSGAATTTTATVTSRELESPVEAELRRRREVKKFIQGRLAQFHLDNDYMLERVADAYLKLMDARRSHKLPKKSALVLTFCIYNTLAKEKALRPLSHVAAVCELPRRELKKLNKMDKHLCLTEDALSKMESHHYILQRAKAEDYAEVFCAHLRHFAGPERLSWLDYRTVERVKKLSHEMRRLYTGRKVYTVMAAAVQVILQEHRQCTEDLKKYICTELGLSQKSINTLVQRLR